jgi:hypothetical protein
MRTLAFATFAVALLAATSASAQQSAREQCCKKLGGDWRTGTRNGYQANYYCYGLGGTGGVQSNAFYQCVSAGGPGKK